MCGRANHAGLTWAELANWMRGITPASVEIAQSFNVPPTAEIPIVRRLGGELAGGFARWGLIPGWHKGSLKDWKASTINARIETVATAPSFRDAFRLGRCLVPLAGYYEWKIEGRTKHPHYIHPSGNAPALLTAGLWSSVRLPDFHGLTCAILTEAVRPPLGDVHDRMPVLVDMEGAEAWLRGTDLPDVHRLPMGGLAWHEVGAAVGSVGNDGPELIEAI